MGGFDPYSSSKGCAELVTSAYRRSFLTATSGPAVASARAGNVIGGGDWSDARLIPDVVKAFAAGEPLSVRNPGAVRPWQHVLEPLAGYLSLAEHVATEGAPFAEAWNFGPEDADMVTVESVLDHCASLLGPAFSWTADEAENPHEAKLLSLNCQKAVRRLKWRPRWGIKTALERTLHWYQAHAAGESMRSLCISQIEDYMAETREH
jgi:CDP-glucose 4,6-dehydratase